MAPAPLGTRYLGFFYEFLGLAQTCPSESSSPVLPSSSYLSYLGPSPSAPGTLSKLLTFAIAILLPWFPSQLVLFGIIPPVRADDESHGPRTVEAHTLKLNVL